MYFCLLTLAIIIIDRVTKLLVVDRMPLGSSIPLIDGVFNLTYILNPGAAFGMLEHNRTFFIVLTCGVLLGAFFLKKHILQEPPLCKYGVALFLGGAIGNLIDRIDTGLVIDFFDFIIWPVFNMADIAICVGVGMIIWSTMEEETKKKKILAQNQ